MPKRFVSIWLALFFASIPLCAKTSPKATPVMPDVTERGRALFEYDQAAWHATDATQAVNPPKDLVGRYVASKSGSRWTVVFGHLNEQRDKFLISYEAVQSADPNEFTVKKLGPPVEDTSFYLASAKAIDVALKDFQRENRPYNVAVLPAASNQLYVYVMPAQTTSNIYPLGGDARYLMTPDGSTIVEKRQLHKTILEIPLDPKAQHLEGFTLTC